MQRSVGAVLPLRSGLVQRLTRWMLFFANSWSGSITSVLISLILVDCQARNAWSAGFRLGDLDHLGSACAPAKRAT